MSVGHYENFPVASRLVPSRYRPAVVAIYRFARAADDLADEGDASEAERLSALDRYGRVLESIARGETPAGPPFAALAVAVREHALPIEPLHDLLSAFRQDVTIGRYARFETLADYCRRSANPIGRLLLALYRADTACNLAHSDAICTGLQLTNFWQDVAIDWRKGRVYVPQEDLARFGVAEAEIGAAQCSERWRALMRFETERARALLDAGRPLVRALPWRLALELRAVIAGARRINDRIDRAQGDVFRRRPTLGPLDWLRVAFEAVRGEAGAMVQA